MIKVKFQGADLPTADKVLVLLNCSQDANHKSVQLCSPDGDHAGQLAYILTLVLRNPRKQWSYGWGSSSKCATLYQRSAVGGKGQRRSMPGQICQVTLGDRCA